MRDETGFAFNVTRQAFLATRLEVADTHFRRLLGLLRNNGKGLPQGRGLWIVPSHGVHTLGMRYPIDVLYLDGAHRVREVRENVRSWRVMPMRMDSATVLELPEHTIFTTGTSVGDQIEFGFSAPGGNGTGVEVT